MKRFTIILTFLLTISILSHAQNGVPDNYPTATINIVDAQSGQEVLANSDTAILFKNALIDLVTNTVIVQKRFKHVMGHNAYAVTQTDPSNGNEYQIQETSRIFGTTVPVYTFIYNVDQNKLYYSNTPAQGGDPIMEPQWISQDNMANLNRCQQYGWFNNLSTPQDNAPQPQQADNQVPVDTAVTAATAPPALPTYEQPECPQDGYLWQPGYWAYSVDTRGYYWVPGVWVAPPNEGLLWTPSYWSFNGFGYFYHGGYWGASIGYYGGINYGYGYGGRGYYGGEWQGGRFRYNTAVVRVNVNVVHNTYVNRTVIVNEPTRNTSSFNGRGGVVAKPSTEELQASRQPKIKQTPDQIRNQWAARNDKNQFATPANGNKPMNIAAPRAPEKSANVTPNQKPLGGPSNYSRPGTNNTNVKPGLNNPNTNPGTSNNTNNNNTKPGSNNTNTRPAFGTTNQRSGTSVPRGTGTPPPGGSHTGTAQPYGSRGGTPSNNNSRSRQPKPAPEKSSKPDKK